MYDVKGHWEGIYQTKNPNEVSWYQEKPQTSLHLIAEIGLDKSSRIIDIGAGDSTLVDNLLALGYKNITILDVSPAALEKSKRRLDSPGQENRSTAVTWEVSDVREFETNSRYDLWHDRATLHFLTAEEDIKKYVDSVKRLVKPGGHLIIAAFSVNGPQKCSGLEIRQYSESSIKKLFSYFEHIKSFEEKHVTPRGASQVFLYSLFRNQKERRKEK